MLPSIYYLLRGPMASCSLFPSFSTPQWVPMSTEMPKWCPHVSNLASLILGHPRSTCTTRTCCSMMNTSVDHGCSIILLADTPFIPRHNINEQHQMIIHPMFPDMYSISRSWYCR
ncbi:hypothetical protein BDR07DRAFT_1436145 [Suillus spraguei]|nr:hypothetical protein BDR07DRAFT_1436145 [Suillus spraguei]